MNSSGLLTDIVFSLLQYQRANHYVGDAWGELTINQQQLLVELGSTPVRTVSDLATTLRLNISGVSHVISQLEKQGLIIRIPGLWDSREVWVGLSPAGKRLLQKIDQLGNSVAFAYDSALTSTQQVKVLDFWRTIADLGGMSKSLPRLGEHPLRPEIRRVTRLFGVTNAQILPVNLRITHLQALVLLKQGRKPTSVITNELKLSTSSTWRTIQFLEERKLVALVKPSNWELTNEGELIVEQLTDLFSQKICKDGLLHQKHLAVLKNGLPYHSAATNHLAKQWAPSKSKGSIIIVPADKYFQISMARHLIEGAYTASIQSKSRSNKCLVLMLDNWMIGAFEYAIRSKDVVEIKSGELIQSQLNKRSLKKVRYQLKGLFPGQNFELAKKLKPGCVEILSSK